MHKSRARLDRSGFTLVELIVAMAILIIIVAAMGQIMGTASSLTTANNKHTDANGRARTIFDRMALDFARMVKRSDVDYIFWKATGNDSMFFYTEGAGYYDGKNPGQPDEKNSVSLVGYRVNNLPAALSYGQMERLGKALLWDGAAGVSPSMIFLNYPVPENQAAGSAAYAYSTLAGGTLSGPTVGTPGNNFTDSTDLSYHPFASNVFRFEYSFQLKDGTQSVIPVMLQTASNGLPSGNPTAGAPPTDTDDSSKNYAAGSRWYDATSQIGYICTDATAGEAVWHEIGIQDISAIVVTIAVIDDQGLVFAKNAGVSLPFLATQFIDGIDDSVDKTWTTAITPTAGSNSSPVSAATHIPQSMVSQIRIYQRFFYINNT